MNVKDLMAKGKMAFGGMVEKSKGLADEVPVLLEKGVTYIPKEKYEEMKAKYGKDLLEAVNSGKGAIDKLVGKMKK